MSRTAGTEDEHGSQTTETHVGPLCWYSPEQLRKKPFSKKSDVFAYGVLLFEIWAKDEPWRGLSPVEAAHKVLGGEPLEAPSSMPAFVRDIMRTSFFEKPS